MQVGREVKRITAPDALIAMADECDPTALYYSRRKGWHFGNGCGAPDNSEQAINLLEQLREEGAGYLVFTQLTKRWLERLKDFKSYLESKYTLIKENNDCVIFRINTFKEK